ncbi:type I inositol 3,4-bisphosphate 4-phosphatase [Elysia marginata]|uniref:Type I inositol 3,4-bisphosphate 4-phosphatase n=1 Tax=Elysia marginata TaxID=1093978 RepID=A0AAV4ES58_9GAST|nr:type I inositol 3,4-bisphosphate 4-phosphatase [Elysia marginata]
MQLQSLREQVHTKTGIDPMHLPVQPNSSVDFESHSDNASQDPVLEVCLACSNLPNDSSDMPPNVLVVLHTMLPPQQQTWLHHNHTEIVEKSSSPQFLKTIGFGDKYGIDTSTRVRVTVHHVVERMTGTMTQLGQAIFTLQDLFLKHDLTLQLTLRDYESKEQGQVTVTAWINDERVSLENLQAQQSGSYNKRPRTVSLGRHSHNLQAHFNDIIKRSFRFATNNEKSMLQMSEYMAESRWTFELPVQLLRLWVNEEKRMISLLQDLGELPFDQGFVQKETSDYSMSNVVLYNQHVAHLNEYEGVTFKRSADRMKEDLEFIPINLHVERMLVSDDAGSKGKLYDVSTMGAFTAHCRDGKNGGLTRLLHQLRRGYYEDTGDEQDGSTADMHQYQQQRTRIQKACTVLNEVTELRQQLKTGCERLSQLAVAADLGKVQTLLANMRNKTNRLTGLCAEPIVLQAAESYLAAKRNADTSEGGDASSLRNMAETGSEAQTQQNWKWSGSNFVKSPTMEPWEVTRLNVEAAFVCLQSIVEELTRQASQQITAQLLMDDFPSLEGNQSITLEQELRPALSKFQGCLEIVWARLSLFLTFLTIMENKNQVKAAHDAKIRRDIVNAHAITTLASAFAACTLNQDLINSPDFGKQLLLVGLLFQVEGLLSCYGNEAIMIEDTVIAVEDLNHISLRLVAETEEEKTNCSAAPKASLGE